MLGFPSPSPQKQTPDFSGVCFIRFNYFLAILLPTDQHGFEADQGLVPSFS
jgi:hypothetical protein